MRCGRSFVIVVDMPTSVSLFADSALCVFIKKFFEVFVNDKIGQMSVIELRSFQRLVAYIEPYGFYQMHFATRCRSRADDVARVLRDFRFYQNNIERHISLPYLILQSYHFCLSFSSVCQSPKKTTAEAVEFFAYFFTQTCIAGRTKSLPR